jgi:hypothetical protein
MKMEPSETQNNMLLSTALGATALILGGYNLHRLMKKYPSYEGYDPKIQKILDKINDDSKVPLSTTFIHATYSSTTLSIMCAEVWKLVTGAYIWHSSMGISALTAAYTFPTATVTFGAMDSQRLYDDAITFTKAAASSISTAAAVLLIATGKAQDSIPGITALAATATFPATLTFFNYKTKTGTEKDGSVVAKAISASVAAAGAASLIASHRLKNRF